MTDGILNYHPVEAGRCHICFGLKRYGTVSLRADGRYDLTLRGQKKPAGVFDSWGAAADFIQTPSGSPLSLDLRR